jgi:hypothetical protein
MAKNIISGPVDSIASPPKGYKGSSGVFDGAHKGPFGKYPRTKSKDGVPEKIYDTAGPFGKFPGQD